MTFARRSTVAKRFTAEKTQRMAGLRQRLHPHFFGKFYNGFSPHTTIGYTFRDGALSRYKMVVERTPNPKRLGDTPLFVRMGDLNPRVGRIAPVTQPTKNRLNAHETK